MSFKCNPLTVPLVCVRENRSGRTSHDSFPGVIVHSEHTNESAGEAYGFHLGWSGNHQMRIEEQSSGRA